MASASPPEGPVSGGRGFDGQSVAFTGKLSSIGRQEAQALVRRLGGEPASDVTSRTTMLVVGMERAAEDKSAKLKRAENLNAGEPGRIRILSEDEFCRLGGLRTNTALSERYYSLRQLRELYPRVHEARLRALHTCGLVRPAERTNADTYYTLADVGVIKQINDELLQGRSFRAAVRERLAARAGQLALDFSAARGDARPAKVVALRRRTTRKIASSAGQPVRLRTDNPEAARAASFFLEGAEYDEGNEADQERARVAYRRALLLDPTLVPAIVNLANIHYAQDELVEAQALYLWALGLDADCFEAHFNLGNIHHDLGRYEEAVGWYRDALRLNPAYADAHFYLAVTLEKMDRPDDAKTHWQAYRRLAPDGEWADLVKLFSE
ncbi:MAG: tetratricopeptide repeat protein [Acidobacteria bacterium]|nr:tetratricopeptide repeat protein [Acidobacteriota bacterium]